MPNLPEPVRAVWTLSRFSLLATLRSPVSVVFALLFPLIFILVFGSIVGDQAPGIKIALAPGCDTSNMVFRAIRAVPAINIINQPAGGQREALKKGKISAILNILPDGLPARPHYAVHIQGSGATPGNSALLRTFIHEAIGSLDKRVFPHNGSVATLSESRLPGRVYRSIDFILPGQLGFSLLMAGIFGSSFLLFNLRQGMVLKRLRATPVRRGSIIAGEMLSRLFFHIIGFVIMVAMGYFAFGFTLINGLVTFMEMLLFSLPGLFIFMGIGFIISGIIRNESAISPVANTIVLPQILLCGLFFPVDSYPHWLQAFCNVLPLTLLVDGLRNIAFEGTHIWQMPVKVGGLVLWAIVTAVFSVKTFKWE